VISCQPRKMMLLRSAVLGVSKLKTQPFPSSLQLFASRLFAARKQKENGIDRDLITEPDMFNCFKSYPVRKSTLWLEALSKTTTMVTVKEVSPTVNAIVLGHEHDLEDLASNVIFVRDFYPVLFGLIRKTNRAVLLGNPGVGKSYFQHYYLARLMNPTLLGDLPPDKYGSCKPPKIVVRQMGTGKMTIFDIENRKAEALDDSLGRVLECFDPKTSLYLMEPGMSKIEPHYEGLSLQTLSTVSPNISRYKEFCKNGAVKFYMPSYTLEELLAIGNFMLDRDSSLKKDTELRNLYTPHLIKERFVEFGGIMRHVLPNTMDKLKQARKDMKQAISDCDARALLRSGNPESTDVSHFVMQYDVEKEGEGRFTDFGLNFTSEKIRLQLQEKVLEQHINDKIIALIKNDEMPSFMSSALLSKVFEDVIWHQLVSAGGVQWHKRTASTSSSGAASGAGKSTDNWHRFSLKVSKVVYGAIPKYENMTENVLYVPTSTTFPFVEAVVKLEGDKLIGFQVTRQANLPKSYNDDPIENFMEKVGLPNLSNFTFVLIPRPNKADTSYLKLDEDSAFKDELLTHVVWKVPTDYKPSTSDE